MDRIRLFSLALIAGSWPIAVCANEGTAADFGARQAVRQISLSPDGATVAFIGSRDPAGETLFVVPVAGGAPKPVLSSRGNDERLNYCSWPSNSRIVCSVTLIQRQPDVRTFTRMVALDSGGGNLKLLSVNQGSRALYSSQDGGQLIDWSGNKPGSVLMTSTVVPEDSTGTRMSDSREGRGVDSLDVTTLKRSVVEQPRRDAAEYITDGNGTVRIMGSWSVSDSTGYAKPIINYNYRQQGSRDWKSLSKVHVGELAPGDFDPYAVDPVTNVAYGFAQENGFKGLYRIKLDGSNQRELVVGRSDVDVDGLVRIGRNRRVVGASFATDRRQFELFDPDLRVLAKNLSNALPGKPAVDFVDASEDGSKLLILSGSDVDPGTFYVYDKTTKQLAELMAVRPELRGARLAPMKPIFYTAKDGTKVPAYLTLPPGTADGAKGLPAIVMPHGGPSSRDEWGFDWLVQYFAGRGYAVLQPNYRGSDGYGAAWFQHNGWQSWPAAIGDIDDAGHWLLAQGIAAQGKLSIVGWSYGGYAALQSGVVEPGLYKAIVAVAPVTDLEMLRQDHRDYTDYAIMSSMIGNGPHVAAGSPVQSADKIAVPVLIFHGAGDQNVDIRQSRAMADRLKAANKQVTFVEFPVLDHQLDDTAARTRVLADTDAFLRKALGLQGVP